MNRRHFLLSTAAVPVARTFANATGDKINVAIIGVNGRGKALAGDFGVLPDVNVAYLVDVDENSLRQAADGFEKRFNQRPKLVGDMRRVFDDKSVAAVAIATPDHWHAPAAILACQAGKDVYVEKPCSHNVREGRLLVEAARKYKRIVQHGTQARSRAATRRAIEVANSGKIGKVLMTKAWNVQKRKDIGHQPDSPVPAGVDFDTWVGPAPFMPFNVNRYHYNWHWNWNFGTGDMGNDGAHQIDQARWALGVDYPTEVSGMARKLFFNDDQQTPDTMDITFSYPGKMLVFEMRIWNAYKMDGSDNAMAIYGSDGMVQIGRWPGGISYRVFDASGKIVMTNRDDKDVPEGESHARNFINCVVSRKAPNAEIEEGFKSALLCHLGNIVARTGRTIRFDPKTDTIPGDAEASKLLTREYRRHWGTPRNV